MSPEQFEACARLDLAIEGGDAQLCADMLRAGAPLEGRESAPRTPLALAAHNGQPDLVELLLSHGCDANNQARTYAPLASALLSEAPPYNDTALRAGVIRQLLEHGADPNALMRVKDRQYSPLQAVPLCTEDVFLRLLLKFGADPHAHSQGTMSPWVDALIAREDTHVLAAFLDHGTSPDKVSGGIPALVRALDAHQLRSAALLLARGADPNLMDAYRGAPLFHAVRADIALGGDEATRLLLAHGADPRAVGARGETVLHHASRGGHAGQVSLLLAAGADANAVDESGKLPVDWAREGDQKEVLAVYAGVAAHAAARKVLVRPVPATVAPA